MINLPVGELFGALQQVSAWLQMYVVLEKGPRFMEIPREGLEGQLQVLRTLSRLTKEIGLATTHNATEFAIERMSSPTRVTAGDGQRFDENDLGRLKDSMLGIAQCMRYEAPTKVAVMLSYESIALYEQKEPLFGDDVNRKFLRVSKEVEEAGKCLALGRSTACVFHLMRTLEVGLDAIRQCLQIKEPKNPNWGAILEPIDKWISNATKKHAEHAYFEELHGRLDVIRRAWRNGTMHVEIVYTEEDAKMLFDATKGLMKRIASRMDEAGLPLAPP